MNIKDTKKVTFTKLQDHLAKNHIQSFAMQKVIILTAKETKITL